VKETRGAEQSDAELLRAARRDPAAFTAFYRMHADWVYRWFAARVRDPSVASDLTAETFAQALVALPRFRGRENGSGTAWIFGIARNLLRRSYEQRRVESKARQRLGIPVSDYVPDGYEEIDARLDAQALAVELEEALGTLGPELRQALELRVVRGLSYEEIAVATKATEVNARMRVSRALRTLAFRMRASEEEEAIR
jgi:RNA polymerase sigma factor (sigma-70 family)